MEFYGIFHGIWTALLIVLFVGIFIWAWSARRKSSFDRAARAPLDEEEQNSGEDKNG
jgi:cytochrome c oxidase cbb3-type subunit 4